MVGDFNIKKFLTENKVTIASQRLNEFQGLGPIVDMDGKPMSGAPTGSGVEPGIKTELDAKGHEAADSVKEFYEIQQEMNALKARLKDMEGKFKGFEGVIKPMLDEMKEVGDKIADFGQYIVKVTKFGGERMDASYKDAFENAVSKVNEATRNFLMRELEASKKITQVKHSINIEPNQLEEGIISRVTNAFKGLLSKITQSADNVAKAVEDGINWIADNVPGGEDVDDTPNPVLEDAPKIPAVPSSKPKGPQAPPMPQVPGKKPAMPSVPSSVDKINLKPANAGVTNPATFAKTLYDMAKKLIAGEGKGFNPETDANIKIAMNALRKAAKIPAMPEAPLKEDLGPKFQEGDTISDPEELGPGPEFDGKILGIFPNLEAAKGNVPNSIYQNTVQSLSKKEDANDTWYLIDWRSEGEDLFPKREVDRMIIAPDGRDFDDYEDGEYDGSIHTDYNPNSRISNHMANQAARRSGGYSWTDM